MKYIILGFVLSLLTLNVFANESVVTQNVNSKTRIHDVDTAVAPSISTNSQDVCAVASSGALQTPVIGVSGGKVVTDENCERLKLAKTLNDLGLKTSAVSVLCQDERVFKALINAGTPCPIYGKTGKAALLYYYDNLDKYKEFKEEILELYKVMVENE